MTDEWDVDDDAIWGYVSPSEARVPEPPVEEQLYVGLSVLRAGLARLRAWVSGDAVPGETRTVDEDRAAEGGGALSDALRDRLAPPPDWTEAVAALDEVVGPDPEATETPPLVYEPAYHDAPSIVEAWGTRQDAVVLEPPPRGRLGEEDGAAWVDAQREEGAPWVLPRLERWWLRTPDGLAFVRALLDAWAAGTLGRGVIGVDRHAWRYLRRAWPGRAPRRVTLQPLSAGALARWFRALAQQGGASEGSVEERDDGRVLPGAGRSSEPGPAATEEEEPPSTFLQSLAAFSDGDPGVAWALWRHSLRAPRPATAGSATAEVPPWADLDRPERPDDLDRPGLLLLHSLVLHGGLSDATLAHVMPVDRYERRDRLRTLRRADVLTKDGETWRVTSLGYPVVCGLLRDEAYLSDRRDDG
ncbi:MAG: hypothetical protein V5A58_06220 [Salinibacter sp.]|uniref:hypothetical protein n=1 Tax=Salinibacter sp. TaxID=2065818 RepID=UPI002FC3B345